MANMIKLAGKSEKFWLKVCEGPPPAQYFEFWAGQFRKEFSGCKSWAWGGQLFVQDVKELKCLLSFHGWTLFRPAS